MKQNKVIIEIEQLTSEWLTRVFKKQGYLEQGRENKINIKNSEVSTTSNMHYMSLEFSSDAQPIPNNPNIVVRLPKHWEYNKTIGRHEAKFYSILAETKNQMPIPTCYDAAISEETGWSHIILEDLSNTLVEIEPLQGSGWHPPPSKRYCEMAINSLADIHAYWWDHPKLNDLSKHAYIFNNLRENSYNEKVPVIFWGSPAYENENDTQLLNRFIKFLGDRISEKRTRLLRNIFLLFPKVAFERIKGENITIVHNDAHLGNCFFSNDMKNQNSKAIFYDWQLWGIGAGCHDLAYMIGFCYYPDYRHKWEIDLIRHYHNNLLKRGIKNYSWDDCWYDYRLFALLNPFKIIWVWSFDAPPGLWWPKLETSISTIEELNCMELLER
ncbi:MAG: phosphotransferase [Promethearchaeota archaeon]